MRKTYILFIFFFVLAQVIISQSCNNGNKKAAAKETLTSNKEYKSHEFGKDCMSCHKGKGMGTAIFTITGSVLDEARKNIQKKYVVMLYTQPKAQGKLVATIYPDASGNFYSTEEIDFSPGLYATLTGTPGVKEPVKHMPTPVFKGSCNSCHGKTAEKLGID